jgi:hypothetical protein
MTKGKARYFSKTIKGELVTMTAHSEGDAVRYVYDGWRDITADVTAAQAAAKQVAADAKADTGKADTATKR